MSYSTAMDQRLHPQLLDHRPHRSRQVDAGRPLSRDHRRARTARDVGAGARQHGSRARARDHDQGAPGPAQLHGRRRPAVRAEPDRHARPRRFQLRGDAIAGGVRGRAAPRRRVAGRRGADAGQRLSRGRHNLEIIPVINKIDLPSAQPEEARRQLEEIIGLDGAGAILASAKEGRGVKEILEAIVTRLHPPKGDPDAPLKALIFDSWYDTYRGVVIVVRVIDGTRAAGHEDPADGDGAGPRGRRARRLHAQARARAGARPRRGRLPRLRHQDRRRRADRRHGHRGEPPDARSRIPASSRSSRWSSPASIRSKGIATRSCARRSRSCG